MVEQMVNSKFSKQGVGDCGSILASFNKQPVVASKNIILRDVQNDNRNAISRPSQKETEPGVGPTRSMPSGILSPPRVQSAGSPVTNQQFVYARRKSDAELMNGRSFKKNSRINPQPQGYIMEPNQSNTPESITVFPASNTANPCEKVKLLNPENGQPTVTKSAPLDESQVRGKQHWRDRFIHLQTYLKYCNSYQEADLKKLRSLTSDEASRKAVELERRAVQLMLEEGREIQRMRDLNILGKQSTSQSASTTLFKSEI